jgi:hypothetical protein
VEPLPTGRGGQLLDDPRGGHRRMKDLLSRSSGPRASLIGEGRDEQPDQGE